MSQHIAILNQYLIERFPISARYFVAHSQHKDQLNVLRKLLNFSLNSDADKPEVTPKLACLEPLYQTMIAQRDTGLRRPQSHWDVILL